MSEHTSSDDVSSISAWVSGIIVLTTIDHDILTAKLSIKHLTSLLLLNKNKGFNIVCNLSVNSSSSISLKVLMNAPTSLTEAVAYSSTYFSVIILSIFLKKFIYSWSLRYNL